MTRKETIKKLDELIAYLNSCRGRGVTLFSIEHKVHSTLKGLPISATTRSAIVNVRASVDVSKDVLKYSSVDAVGAEYDKIVIVEMINILNREKDSQNKAMQDEMQKVALEEQRKGNVIQYRAFWCSIIATIISLMALIVAIWSNIK